LPSEDRVAIANDIGVLETFGPQLGRPHVDHIKGSKHANMKELRTRHHHHQYRTLFAFDPIRRGILLLGGDKTGTDQERFYESLIAHSDLLFDRHLETLQRLKSPEKKRKT
jgi:hypothetical protein